jgi:hypothetical protein
MLPWQPAACDGMLQQREEAAVRRRRMLEFGPARRPVVRWPARLREAPGPDRRVEDPDREGAALVLDDLLDPTAGAASATRIVARSFVLRAVRLAGGTDVDAAVAARARAGASLYLAALPGGDGERRALTAALALARRGGPPRLIDRLLRAADFADTHEHPAGAHQLRRAAYVHALERRWLDRAAVVARRIAGVARRAGATRVAREWTLRACFLEGPDAARDARRPREG